MSGDDREVLLARLEAVADLHSPDESEFCPADGWHFQPQGYALPVPCPTLEALGVTPEAVLSMLEAAQEQALANLREKRGTRP